MQYKPEKKLEKVIHRAKAMGVDEVLVYMTKNTGSQIIWKNQKKDGMKKSVTQGIGIQVRKGGKVGFSHTSNPDDRGIADALRIAVNSVDYGNVSRPLRLTKEKYNRKIPHVYDSTLPDVSLGQKIDYIRETERQAVLHNALIHKVDSTEYEDGIMESWLMDQEGTLRYQRESYVCLSTSVIGELNGEYRSGYGVGIEVDWKDISPLKIGTRAAERATQLLGAREIKTGVRDLVLSPEVARQIFSIIAQCFYGDSILKHKSFLEGKMGEVVASPAVTIVDDGALGNRIGSGQWDGEGTRMRRTILLNRGVLTNYLLDKESAAKLSMDLTGNSLRNSYNSLPHISTTNYYLAKGHRSPDKLIRDVQDGVYITEVMGLHTANPISGNISLGASGIRIQNGELREPVHRMTIAGNISDLLMNTDEVGNDLTVLGSKGAPTVRIRNIMVSGK